MKGSLLIGTLLACFLFGCSRNEFDATNAAKDYCDCILRERNSGHDFFDARTKCDGILLGENHFFRVTYIEDKYGRYMTFLPRGLRDSAVAFRNVFNTYIQENCCKIAAIGCDTSDELQRKRRAIDSLFK